MSKISIIVPVYNTEKYLRKCIDSILNQTYSNMELILVDDGSKDLSPWICDQYAVKDSRVRVIHKENGGVSTARNAGLEIAGGEYIAFVDSDDYLELCMYEKMMDKAMEHECDVIMCDCIKEYAQHRETYSHHIRSGFYSRDQLKEEYYPHLLMMENVEYPATISNCTLLWRSTLNTLDMRYEPGIRYSEDLLFGARLMSRAESFYYMKGEAYYHYVMNPVSASHTYAPDKWNDYIRLHGRIRDTFHNYEGFDFSYQIDLCLLFFLYNRIREIYKTDFTVNDKKAKIKSILMTPEVVAMFKSLRICRLKVTTKQKWITFMYKYQIGLSRLITYYWRKEKQNENKCDYSCLQ